MSQELKDQFGQFDYVNDDDRGAQNLIEFLKYSPNVKALINSVMPEFQELNDAQQDVYSNINIFDAIGSQLDDIFGTLLNLERETGQSDDDYKLALLSQATVLSRSGEIAVMKSLYKNLVSASSVSLYEFMSAAFKMEAQVSTMPSESELVKIRETLINSKQGGNSMSLSLTDGVGFRLGNYPTPNLNDPNGLSGGGFTGGTLYQGF